jgi:glycosyltransferase involved in cell wall biosynthesis
MSVHPIKHLGVLIPFYNEADVLPHCLDRLLAVLKGIGLPYDVLLVDDGSTDHATTWLCQNYGLNPHSETPTASQSQVRLLRLSRNFGKEAALTAGLAHVRGDAVLILDADLQDPPELLPIMLAKAQQGFDMVVMQRRDRAGETWLKRASAHLFYRVLGAISAVPIPTDTGDFRLLSRACITALNALPEANRFMKGLFAWVGFKTAKLTYDRDARVAGQSKWGLLKLFGLALDGITSFSALPLRLASLLGVGIALLGCTFGGWIVLKALLFGEPVRGYPSLMVVITLLGGAHLMAIGLLGEYVGKIYLEVKQRPLYITAELLSGHAP